MSDDIYDDYTVDELEDALQEAKHDLEFAKRNISDIEDALYAKRDKPVIEARRKLERWTKAVRG